LKNLLLIPFFLFAPVFSNPQDAGLHLFGPQNKIVDFTLFNVIIGKFNCKTGEFKITEGENYSFYPKGKWISKQYVMDNTEESRDSDGNLIFTAQEMGEAEYSLFEESAKC
tara:strand:- start:335 stop:667 length:333 start_codon:yes stop_codon:yes gene_type:complete